MWLARAGAKSSTIPVIEVIALINVKNLSVRVDVQIAKLDSALCNQPDSAVNDESRVKRAALSDAPVRQAHGVASQGHKSLKP
jgi:hypothetical protein